MYGYQEPTGRLISNLAASPDKINDLLSGFLKYDPFLAKLVRVSNNYNKYALSNDQNERKKVQTIQMCILRNDFMIDQPNNDVKLVEYNTIASSFGVLSTKVVEMQRYIRGKYGKIVKYNYQQINEVDDLS